MQLKSTKQGIKVDNPAQLEKVIQCIERCHQLQKFGSRPHSMKGRQQLLRDLQDDLRWLSQVSGRSTLGRSNTTVEERRATKKATRFRRSSVALAKIKEEMLEHESSSAVGALSLPRSAAINLRKSENRPRSLLPQSSTRPNGKDKRFSQPKGGGSKSGGLSGSPKKNKKSPNIKRAPLRFAAATSSPEKSPIASQFRSKKSPKWTSENVPPSAEYAAGYDEDTADLSAFDNVVVNSQTSDNSPSQSSWLGALSSSPGGYGGTTTEQQGPGGSGALVIGNAGKSASPFQTKKKVVSFESHVARQQSVVSVEIHHESESSEVHQNSEVVDLLDQAKPSTVDLSTSQDDTLGNSLVIADLEASDSSALRLLPHANDDSVTEKPASRRRRKRSKSPIVVVKRKISLSQPNVQGDDQRDSLIEFYGRGSPYFAWERKAKDKDKTRDYEVHSLDRKQSMSGGVYNALSFENEKNDDELSSAEES